MKSPIKVLLISVYPLWADACRYVLESCPPREIAVATLIADDGLSSNLPDALAICPDVVVVSLDIVSEGLNPVRVVRSAGYSKAVLVICSHYALPSLKELTETDAQGIITLLASLNDLISSIHDLADGKPDPMLQQYLRAARTLIHKPLARSILNEREREILKLVASDLTDHEIAAHLRVSPRTVSNQLHNIYARLGVKGRAGAVIAALMKGLIRLDT